jgi:hypothetical protein
MRERVILVHGWVSKNRKFPFAVNGGVERQLAPVGKGIAITNSLAILITGGVNRIDETGASKLGFGRRNGMQLNRVISVRGRLVP